MRILAVGLGAVHTFVAIERQWMNPDGISYLDMGDAFLRGDWEMAVNGIWSPLYALMLAAANQLLEPSMAWKFPVAQIVNFLVYLFALLCFEFFWRQLTFRYESLRDTDGVSVGFHPTAWLVLGYSLFIWSSLELIQLWYVTPDMTIAALVYLAAGLLLRLAATESPAPAALALGSVLGLGYLAKAALMPLGIVCLLSTLLLPAGSLGRVKRLSLAAAAFLAVSAPMLIALSLESGKPSFTDVSRFAYLKHVNEMPFPDFTPALDRLQGRPEHSPRRLLDNPAVLEFAEPVGGTYPMGYDPGYWTAGIEPTVSIQQQLRVLATNLLQYFDLYIRKQGGWLGVISILGVMSLVAGVRQRSVGVEFALIGWALAAHAMYSLVYVEPRYLAAFVVLMWAAILALIRQPNAVSGRHLMNASAVLLAGFVWINIASISYKSLTNSSASMRNQLVVAEALVAEGLRAGDEVGFIGASFEAFWAKLVGVRITAEISPVDIAQFWQSSESKQSEVLEAFAGAPTVAVVAQPLTVGRAPEGWRTLGETGYLLYVFPR